MKRTILVSIIACAALLAPVIVVGQSSTPPSHACRAVFSGSSTLHDFAGIVDATLVQAAFDRNTWRVRIEFPVTSMNTKNASRDTNMRKMFEVEKFPVIVASASNLPYPDRAPPTALTGTLKIRDREQPVGATLENFSVKGGVASFHLRGEVSLAAFGLKAPRAMLGMVRVGDKVKLEGRLIICNWPHRPAPE